jgi:NADH-quinone oxidoreductase subunit J
LGVLTIVGAAAALTLRNLVRCVLALALSFIGLAGLYLQLGAQFIGFVQVLVYVGAVAILVVFAILLTQSADSSSEPIVSPSWLASCAVSVLVFGILAWAAHFSVASGRVVPPQHEATVKQIGDALMLRFALPLEVVGLLLTAALVGAVTIAVQEKKEMK